MYVKNPKEKMQNKLPKKIKTKKGKIKYKLSKDRKGTISKINNFITLKMDFV